MDRMDGNGDGGAYSSVSLVNSEPQQLGRAQMAPKLSAQVPALAPCAGHQPSLGGAGGGEGRGPSRTMGDRPGRQHLRWHTFVDAQCRIKREPWKFQVGLHGLLGGEPGSTHCPNDLRRPLPLPRPAPFLPLPLGYGCERVPPADRLEPQMPRGQATE
eukprot:11033855-Alexandrium_andersonii.AAC.1